MRIPLVLSAVALVLQVVVLWQVLVAVELVSDGLAEARAIRDQTYAVCRTIRAAAVDQAVEWSPAGEPTAPCP